MTDVMSVRRSGAYAVSVSARKVLVRRTDREYSQPLRLAFQLAFLALNVWIGIEFYAWVRYVETSGATRAATRPPGIEGWLPIAALMNLKAFIATGEVPRVHAAGMFLLIAFLAISLLVKKAFCSWLCPVGTISEWLWRWSFVVRRSWLGIRGAKHKPRTTNRVTKWLDITFRSLKYLILGFFGWAIAHMSAGEITEFMQSPYGLIADVKLLNFFRFIGTTGLVVIAIIVVLSLFIENFWCRYLCPYGALLGLTALASPVRIRRDAGACIDCAKCAKVCPARLPVDSIPQVFSAECAMCMQCVAVCPAKGALEVKITKRRALPAWSVAAAIALLLVAAVGVARLSGHWNTKIPFELYHELVTNAQTVSHPMPR